jgi:transcriptional regulator with XRE-family HTH domain
MKNLFQELAPHSGARRRPKSSTNALAEQFTELRLNCGLTQKELAAEAKVGLSQIRKIEQGKTNVTLGTLLSILSALNGEMKINARSKSP